VSEYNSEPADYQFGVGVDNAPALIALVNSVIEGRVSALGTLSPNPLPTGTWTFFDLTRASDGAKIRVTSIDAYNILRNLLAWVVERSVMQYKMDHDIMCATGCVATVFYDTATNACTSKSCDSSCAPHFFSYASLQACLTAHPGATSRSL
jgi:hypothetical protein